MHNRDSSGKEEAEIELWIGCLHMDRLFAKSVFFSKRSEFGAMSKNTASHYVNARAYRAIRIHGMKLSLDLHFGSPTPS